MQFWWVSQNQTYRQETEGGYLWSPKRNRDNGYNPFYEFMKEVAPGDVIFSFADTWIRKIGIAQDYCRQFPRPPEYGAAGRAWNEVGWKIKVRFFELDHPVRPKDHIDTLRPLLPDKLSPLRPTGDGNQMYLASVPLMMAQAIGRLIGPEFIQLSANAPLIPVDELSQGSVEDQDTVQWDKRLVEEILEKPTLSPTEREAVIQARVGQGLFRQNLAKIEKRCRLTGVTEPTHLRASHTKPWRTSTDEERLNGENGLLLTPTIDHLFDRGFISFENSGELLVSKVAHPASLERMGVPYDKVVNVGDFTSGQKQFLTYHRENVFLARQEH